MFGKIFAGFRNPYECWGEAGALLRQPHGNSVSGGSFDGNEARFSQLSGTGGDSREYLKVGCFLNLGGCVQ